MSSDKVELAKKLIALHPEWFEALEAYDERGRLKRFPTKIRVNFTVDEELYHKFRQFCRRKGLKMSQVMEQKILEFLKESGEVAEFS
ncbi:MAG: plasmid partition protein ParG [Candidatus Hadarchaeales archaeon]